MSANPSGIAVEVLWRRAGVDTVSKAYDAVSTPAHLRITAASPRLQVPCRPQSLSFASKVVLHLVVVPRKIKSEHSFLRLKNEPPPQPSAALVKPFAQFPNRQPGVSVRLAKTRQDELQDQSD